MLHSGCATFHFQKQRIQTGSARLHKWQRITKPNALNEPIRSRVESMEEVGWTLMEKWDPGTHCQCNLCQTLLVEARTLLPWELGDAFPLPSAFNIFQEGDSSSTKFKKKNQLTHFLALFWPRRRENCLCFPAQLLLLPPHQGSFLDTSWYIKTIFPLGTTGTIYFQMVLGVVLSLSNKGSSRMCICIAS